MISGYRRRFIAHPVAAIALLVAAIAPVRAQVTGLDDAPPPPRDARSSRPILVKVEFEGNEDEDLGDRVLAAQIKSKGTERPALRVFSIFALVYDLNPVMPQYMRDEMHEIVDSLSGQERYLNPRDLKEDTMELRTIYNQFGYPEAELDYRIIIDTARNRSIIRFFIDEGPRYRNHGIHYVGIEDVPEDVQATFRDPVEFEIGDDYKTSEVVAETGRAIAELQNRGYPFAGRTHLLTIQRHDSVNNLRYDSTIASIYTGNRYRFGETVYRPDTEHEGRPMKEWVVLRQIEYDPGEWYSRQKVDQTLSNLYGLGVFEYVRLDSLSERSTDDTLGMQLVTSLLDPRTLQLTPEASFERYINDYYAFVGATARFTHLNLLGGAEKLTLEARGRMPAANVTSAPSNWNLLTYGATATYLDPTLLGLRWSYSLAAGYDRAIEDRVIEGVKINETESQEFTFPLVSDRFFGSAEVSYRFPTHTFISSLTARSTVQHLRYSGVRDYILKKAELRVRQEVEDGDVLPPDEAATVADVYEAMVEGIFREQVWLGDNPAIVSNPDVREEFNALKTSVVLTGSAVGDDRDHPFAVRNGHFLDARVEFGSTLAWTPFVKLEGDARKYMPWGDDKTFAFRVHGGFIVPFGDIRLVPLTSRFWAGGANSMRGWGPREMLVTRQDTTSTISEEVVQEVLRDGRRLLGGLTVFEAMVDWRWRPFSFPASSTLLQQVNQLMLIVGIDAGGAFFRDYVDEGVNVADVFKEIATNFGLATSVALGYDTPIGPIRFGFGWALRDPVNYPNREGEEKRSWVWQRPVTIGDWAWFFSIAHAF
jgi:outer membrane protein assembly factor BamA